MKQNISVAEAEVLWGIPLSLSHYENTCNRSAFSLQKKKTRPSRWGSLYRSPGSPRRWLRAAIQTHLHLYLCTLAMKPGEWAASQRRTGSRIQQKQFIWELQSAFMDSYTTDLVLLGQWLYLAEKSCTWFSHTLNCEDHHVQKNATLDIPCISMSWNYLLENWVSGLLIEFYYIFVTLQIWSLNIVR